MRRGAYHSVVKGKSQTAFRGEMTVDHVHRQLVGVAQGGEKKLCLTGKIVLFAYGDQLSAPESRELSVIAEDGAIFVSDRIFEELKL